MLQQLRTVVWAVGLFGLGWHGAWAQNAQRPPSNDVYQPAAIQDKSLLEALGGQPGIQALVSDFVDRSSVDPRIMGTFKDVNLKLLKESITSQLCYLAGGGCVYEGESMRNAHRDMNATMAQYNALVEDLQLAMQGRQIPFKAQNQLLSILAPMYRDIVKVP